MIYRFWFLVCSDSARDTQWKRDRDSERFLCKRIRLFTVSVQRICTLLERANGALWLILETLTMSRGSNVVSTACLSERRVTADILRACSKWAPSHDVLQCFRRSHRDNNYRCRCDVVALYDTLLCVHWLIILLKNAAVSPWGRSIGVTGILRWYAPRGAALIFS